MSAKRLFLTQFKICECLAALERPNIMYMDGSSITFPTREPDEPVNPPTVEPDPNSMFFKLVGNSIERPNLKEAVFILGESVPVGFYWVAETHSRIQTSGGGFWEEFDLREVPLNDTRGYAVYAADWMDDEGKPEWRGFCWHSPATMKRERSRLELEVLEQYEKSSKVRVKYVGA